jgi:[ribosomal protein S18]-alanine N-acetyltransferase
VKPARSKSGIRRISHDSNWAVRRIFLLQVARFGMRWRETDIRDLLRSDAMTGFAYCARHPGGPSRMDGYILFRTMADEGEILSMAVHPRSRRQGIARSLLSRAFGDMRAARVNRVFLEVSAANRAARRFYLTTGFRLVGQRRGYYATKLNGGQDALVLCSPITPPGNSTQSGKSHARRKSPYPN